jgi:hypothetical protein
MMARAYGQAETAHLTDIPAKDLCTTKADACRHMKRVSVSQSDQ